MGGFSAWDPHRAKLCFRVGTSEMSAEDSGERSEGWIPVRRSLLPVESKQKLNKHCGREMEIRAPSQH